MQAALPPSFLYINFIVGSILFTPAYQHKHIKTTLHSVLSQYSHDRQDLLTQR